MEIGIVWQYVITAGASFAAGLVQAVTGFGAGIVMMLFFPLYLPVLNASAVSSAITVPGNAAMTWRYRKNMHKELLILPIIVFCICASLALEFAGKIPTGIILKIFGGFLILLSLYFLIFARNFHIKATPVSAAICGALSGTVSGLFGISGPPMVIYYLAALSGKEDYMGTIQTFFLFTGLYTFIYRIFKGYFTLALIPMTLVGILGMLAGKWVGDKIIDRLNANTMRIVIYVVLIISGIINIVK